MVGGRGFEVLLHIEDGRTGGEGGEDFAESGLSSLHNSRVGVEPCREEGGGFTVRLHTRSGRQEEGAAALTSGCSPGTTPSPPEEAGVAEVWTASTCFTTYSR